MIEGDGFGLKVIAHSAGSGTELKEKPEVDKNVIKDVLFYKGRIFEVPYVIVQYLADLPDQVLVPRIRRTMENGMGFMYPDGGFSCHYCNHYSSNLANIARDDEAVIHNTSGTVGIGVNGCNYQGNPDIKWASPFRKKENGRTVMIQRTPCVVKDSMVAELAEQGLLDEYEVKGRDFSFPTFKQLDECPELEKQYEVKVPVSEEKREVRVPKRSLISRLFRKG